MKSTRRLVKVRQGTQAWVDISNNPQTHRNEIMGEITGIIGLEHFHSKVFGFDSILKVKFRSPHTDKRVGYLGEVVIY